MRLLNVYNFNLEAGIPDEGFSAAEAKIWSQSSSTIPRYAILSHRWIDGEEVTFDSFSAVSKIRFQDVPSRNSNSQHAASPPSTEKNASSVYKIGGACQNVRSVGDKTFQHIWIDTVCIDKSDAQELSIAINSMFRWYENAEVCYVYMVDVSWAGPNDVRSREQFARSQWFKRGWTLQELLAPKRLEFFDRDWKHIGSKQDLADDISDVTGISREHLLVDFRPASLAQKMSWLATRETKYPADLSYCMLGILGVGNLKGLFMDARYSQGTKEFQRLQIEIIKKWDPAIPFDDSLFAWRSSEVVASGLLAPAPSCFRTCGSLVFEPRLAKLRHSPLGGRGGNVVQPSRTGTSIGISFDDGDNMSFVATWILPIPIANVLFFATFGILAWLTLVPESGRQRVIRHRDVALNCWERRSDGQLGVQKIKMEKNNDGTWQRVDCGVLVPSSRKHIYPSRFVAATYPALMRITSSPAQLRRG